MRPKQEFPMRYRFCWPALATAALLLVLFAGLSAASADSFTPDQRRDIEAVVHDYLVKHPDIMLEVLPAAEDKIKSDTHDTATQAQKEHRRELRADPNS